MGYYQAGAEMCGDDARRAKADAYRALSDLTGGLIRAHIVILLSRTPVFSVQSQDRL
jgi:hypothetical protein